jgi:integrase
MSKLGENGSVSPAPPPQSKALKINALQKTKPKTKPQKSKIISFILSDSEKCNAMTDKKNVSLYDAGGNLKAQWYVFYYVKKGGAKIRIKVSGGINRKKTLDERYEAAAQLKLKIESGLESQITESKQTIDAVLKTEMDKRVVGLRKKTVQSYCAKLNQFLKYCRDHKIRYTHQVTEDVANDFQNWLVTSEHLHPSTRDNYREKLKTLFDIVVGEKANPFRKVRPIKHTTTPALYFQRYQQVILKKYFMDSEPQLWLFIQFIYYCLIRPGELRLLKIGDIFLDDSKILVGTDISKNKKNQYVAIPDAFMDALMESGVFEYPPNYYVFGKGGEPSNVPVAINYFSKRHQTVLKAKNFDTKKHKLYSWKHTGAVSFIKAGGSVKELQIQGRWHSLDQVNQYLRDLGLDDLDGIKKNFPPL